MPGTFTKPDANPGLAALLSLFFDLGHVVVNGQQRKWIYTTLVVHVGLLACCVPGIVLRVLSMMDSYQTAQRLQAGETISDNEYSQPLLFKIVSAIDQTATCARA